MRLTHLFLTCCILISTSLVVAQEEASAVSSVISTIPSSVIGGGIFHDDSSIKINKEIEIEAKDIIVNIGKVDIEIEREKQKRRSDLELATVEDDHHIKHDDDGNKIKINKEIEIEAKDIVVNIGKVKVEIEKDKHERHTTKKPTHKPTWTPTWKPTHKPTYKPIWTPSHKPKIGAVASENGDVYDDNTTIPLFEDVSPAAEPSADEVVLGENATAITVQGGEHQDERGVLILTGPQIFSVTFKIVKEKVITIAGSDFNTATDMKKRKQREAVTFIIRGRGFVPGGNLFNQIDDVVGGTSRGGMFSILEPQVFLGAIPLKVVRFTDTTILARFLDIEDQRRFEAGTFLARVKVLHIDVKKEKKKKHGPGEDIGILGDHEEDAISGIGGITLVPNGFPAVLAALNQPSLFTRSTDGLITSPVLGVIDNPLNQHENKDDHHDHDHDDGISTSLLGLFSGLRFDTAVLAVQFSEKDAQKIRGSSSTLFNDADL